jgi:hypothetical protein
MQRFFPKKNATNREEMAKTVSVWAFALTDTVFAKTIDIFY